MPRSLLRGSLLPVRPASFRAHTNPRLWLGTYSEERARPDLAFGGWRGFWFAAEEQHVIPVQKNRKLSEFMGNP